MKDIVVNTPGEFADYVMDELGRWAAIDCPIAFKSRVFKTPLFSNLYNKQKSPLGIKFTKNGFIVVKIFGANLDVRVTKFSIANPSLRDNMASCFQRLNDDDLSDFISTSEARSEWKRSLQ